MRLNKNESLHIHWALTLVSILTSTKKPTFPNDQYLEAVSYLLRPGDRMASLFWLLLLLLLSTSLTYSFPLYTGYAYYTELTFILSISFTPTSIP